MVDPLRFYDLERYLFEDVNRRFHAEGSLGAFDLFSIIVWKANRAKSKLAKRLLVRHGSLEESAREMTAAVFHVPTGKERLRILMHQWGFYLPMASSILCVLWPDEFTVYDKRVCDELGDFHWLSGRKKFNSIWVGYEAYLAAVNAAAPSHLSLRDKDRYLWGGSASKQLLADLARGFGHLPG